MQFQVYTVDNTLLDVLKKDHWLIFFYPKRLLRQDTTGRITSFAQGPSVAPRLVPISLNHTCKNMHEDLWKGRSKGKSTGKQQTSCFYVFYLAWHDSNTTAV